MITTATLIAVLVDIAVGQRALQRIKRHEEIDMAAHAEFRARLNVLDSAPSSPAVGFAVARKEEMN